MDFWSTAYRYKWATKDQLKEATALNLITADQYKEITGEIYK
ncbi:XkdX family protein [Caproiciproducens galactitolivorans]|uniref:XkdX family protein n=1 Tax=Caproiciproducens galactitolivorans TaxID=642589 RepID=A0ABT4BWG0_9FIRM|nr:XkdX family protein [Caproiciproducens galactitolivorans]MCY1715236.1 XkdX family protein [Caproiciproducens galactitolivorans]